MNFDKYGLYRFTGISQEDRQLLDSYETCDAVGLAILAYGKCARIGSKRFERIWANPTPSEIEIIKKIAIEIELNYLHTENPSEKLYWGETEIDINKTIN